MPREPRQRERALKESGDTFTRNLVLGMVGLVVLSGVVFTFLDRKDGGSANSIPLAIDRIDASNNGEPVIPTVATEDAGITFNESAPLKIDIWEDFQCPYCGRFEAEIGGYLEDLKRSGSAKVVYHMASFLGLESKRAANAAYCAVPEGRFIEFHKALYQIQGAENSGLFSNRNLVEVGKRLGINSATFEECVNSESNSENVAKVAASMEKSGVNSTPTVFINGKLWRPSSGTFNLAEFQSAVEAAR